MDKRMTCPLGLSTIHCGTCYWTVEGKCAYGRECQHCGHLHTPDEPVIEINSYIGGQGYVKVTECLNRILCWQRIDAQNALTEKIKQEAK